MAFGKDSRQSNMGGGYGRPTFGQQNSARNHSHSSRGGSKTPYWLNGFDISEDPAVPDTFRLIRGEYIQTELDRLGNPFDDVYGFVRYREHFYSALRRGGICSAGPYFLDRHKREPCKGCDIYWEDKAEQDAKKARGDNSKGPRRISMTDRYAYNLWSYAYHFEMPDTDKNGQYRMNPKTNQPYTTWSKAPNPNLPIYAGHPYRMGHLYSWAIGRTWNETLITWNRIIDKSCLTCGARDSILSRGWYCPHCSQLIIDPTNTTSSAEQIREVVNSHFSCPHCGTCAYLQEAVWCQSCSDGSQGKRASIFDVDLTGVRQRVSDTSTILTIMGYSNPTPIERLITDPEVLARVKPQDLVRKFAPTTVEEQCRIWNLQSTSPQYQQPQTQPQYQQPQYQQPQYQQPQWSSPPGMPPYQQPIQAQWAPDTATSHSAQPHPDEISRQLAELAAVAKTQ